MNAELLFEAGAQLGEGALWNSDSGELYWVDIEGMTFNAFNPDTAVNRAYHTAKRIGTVVPVVGGEEVLVALEDGIATIDLTNGSIDYKLNTNFHLDHDRRFNDGKCDPHGRFWVGTHSMSGVRGVSSLYAVSNAFDIDEKVTGVSISNGIVWNADGSKMYYIDTPSGKVVQYDFDPSSGNISNKTTVIEIPEGMGDPDGMAIDSLGRLWIALWDGFGVGCFDPATGQLIEKVNVPAPKVTSCAFGGNDLNTLFITTASVEMTEEEKEKYPLSGSVFYVTTAVKGVEAHKFSIV